MVTQTIKRWLQKLFAWWPWKSNPATSSIHSSGILQKKGHQGSTLGITEKGAASQPIITSVVVEQEAIFQADWSSTSNELSPERIIDAAPSEAETTASVSPSPSEVRENSSPSSPGIAAVSSHHQLEFLRYLVRHGLVNEGFAQDHLPDQYKKK